MEGLYLGTFAFGVIFTIASFALGAFGGGHGVHLHGLDLHGGSDKVLTGFPDIVRALGEPLSKVDRSWRR